MGTAPDKKKKIFKTIGNVLVVIAVIFLVRKYRSLGIDISEYINKGFVIKLIPVLLLFSVLISFQFIPWVLIVRALTGSSIPASSFYRVFQRANIMKYIPGNIFQYIGRGEILSEDDSLNVANIAASVLIESFSLAFAALLLGFCGGRAYLETLFFEHRAVFLTLTGCCLAVMIILTIFRSKIKEWARLKGIIVTKRLILNTALSVCFFFLTFLIQAFFQIIIIYSLSDSLNIKLLLTVGGAFSVSWLAGYITPGASGGIGVREALFCLMLEQYIAGDILLISVIIFRVVNIIVDMIAYAFSELSRYAFRSSKTV